MIQLTGSYVEFKLVVSRHPTLVYTVGGIAATVNGIVALEQDFRWVPNATLVEADFLADFPEAVKIDSINPY